MPTTETNARTALENRNAAETALIAFAQGQRHGTEDQADALLRVFAAASEHLTAATAALALPDIPRHTDWLARRQPAFTHGGRQFSGRVGERGHHLLRAWHEARAGLWRWTHPDDADQISTLLRNLDQELALLAAGDARTEFGDGQLAAWLNNRGRGAL